MKKETLETIIDKIGNAAMILDGQIQLQKISDSELKTISTDLKKLLKKLRKIQEIK